VEEAVVAEEEAEVDKIIVITKTQKKKNRQNIKIMKTKKLTEALVEIEEEVAEATEVIVVAEEEVVAVKAMDSIMRSSNMT
jgi:GTPase SAR1 family protein